MGRGSATATSEWAAVTRRTATALTSATVTVADVNAVAVRRVTAAHSDVAVADPRPILAEPPDVYSPCAMGGELDDTSVPTLQAKVICGAANNQLAHPGILSLIHISEPTRLGMDLVCRLLLE